MKREDIVTHEIYHAVIDIHGPPTDTRVFAIVKILDCGRNVQQIPGGFRFGYQCDYFVIRGAPFAKECSLLKDFVYADEIHRVAIESERKLLLLSTIK